VPEVAVWFLIAWVVIGLASFVWFLRASRRAKEYPPAASDLDRMDFARYQGDPPVSEERPYGVQDRRPS